MAEFCSSIPSNAMLVAAHNPDSPKKPADGAAADRALNALAGKTVLLVEDEYLVGLDMAHTFRSWGMSVTGPIQTLKEAEAAGGGDWDCAVLDVRLNGDNTLDLARRLKAVGVIVVFVTAYSGDDSRFGGDLSVIPRLGKPVPFRTLRKILSDAVSAP